MAQGPYRRPLQERGTGPVSEPLRFTARPEFHSPTLVIGWALDGARLGWRVTDYLITALGGKSFCSIEPVDFFPLGGVTVWNDLVLFPESRFYACPEQDLVVFRSAPPASNWYRFLHLIMDVAREYCHVREVYTVGSMVAIGPHTADRQFFATTNSADFKQELAPYGITREVNYETPPEGRPTLNSYCLWTAKRRGITGANLWTPIPFYLVSSEDPAAYRRMVGFLNHRLGLGLELGDLDEQTRQLYQRIDRIRASSPDVDSLISRLENGENLEEGEGEKLANAVEKALQENQA